jgi:hypothetical protein
VTDVLLSGGKSSLSSFFFVNEFLILFAITYDHFGIKLMSSFLILLFTLLNCLDLETSAHNTYVCNSRTPRAIRTYSVRSKLHRLF